MKYLITGIPGVGKTTIGESLVGPGCRSVDTDTEPGIARWYNSTTGKPVRKKEGATAEWYEQHSWDWDLEALEKLLSSFTGPTNTVYVTGMTTNIVDGFLFSIKSSCSRQLMILQDKE